MNGSRKAHVLVYSSCVKRRLVAHCLELDLVGTGETLEEAFEELMGCVGVYFGMVLKALDRGEKIAPPIRAPERFWQAAANGTPLGEIKVPKIKGWVAMARRRRAARFPAPPKTCERIVPGEHSLLCVR